MGFATVAFAALLAAEPGVARPDDVISELTQQDVVAAATALGWAIGESDRTIDGGFHQTLILPNGAPATVAGFECEGQPQRCSSYYMNLNFGLGNTERVEKAKAELRYQYAQVVVRDPMSFGIARAEFLNGGITRKHLELSLETFGIIATDAVKFVFPCGMPVDGQEPECDSNKEFMR